MNNNYIVVVEPPAGPHPPFAIYPPPRFLVDLLFRLVLVNRNVFFNPLYPFFNPFFSPL
jgi:hypothetical protein